MSVEHASLTSIHLPWYYQSSDPGAVGPHKIWIDSTTPSSPMPINQRNTGNSGWARIGYMVVSLTDTDLVLGTDSTQVQPVGTRAVGDAATAAPLNHVHGAGTVPVAVVGTTDQVQVSAVGNSTQTANLAEITDHGGTHGLFVGPTGEVIMTASGSDGLLMSGKQIGLIADGDDVHDAVAYGQLTAIGWQGAWSGATTYAASAIVTGSDNHVYLSKSARNLNNDPIADAGVHWQALNA